MTAGTLILGFGAFPGVAENPSGTLARSLEGPGRKVVILPVTWQAIAEIPALLEAENPNAVLAFGVAPRRQICVETKALNAAHPFRPDASGQIAAPRPLDLQAPPVLASSFPALRLAVHLGRAGLVARPSRNAGRYLCNALLFHLIAHERALGVPCAFLHIPPFSNIRGGRRVLERAARQALWFMNGERTRRKLSRIDTEFPA